MQMSRPVSLGSSLLVWLVLLGASAPPRSVGGGEPSTERAGTTVTRHLPLRYLRFDPLEESPLLPAPLRAGADGRLWIVQRVAPLGPGPRDELRRAGAQPLLFLGDHTWVVEVAARAAPHLRALDGVRSVTPFHPAFKLHPSLLPPAVAGGSDALRVHVLTTRRGQQVQLGAWLAARGGELEQASPATHLARLRVPRSLLAPLASSDLVQWVEPWAEPGTDMNLARQFHGSEALWAVLGLSGLGLRVEVMDQGVDLEHPAFSRALVHNGNTPSLHGTSVAGIVVGNGAGEPPWRGVLPDATLVVGDFDRPWAGGNRYAHTAQLSDPALPYRCVLQTNSWGGARTTSYGALSHDMDLMLFDLARLSITQSMGNSGAPVARPEAWAKNVLSVGGISHANTLTIADDSWGGASNGPAEDGRIKPDLASFYDSVTTTQSGGGYTQSFGGNSAATAITAGHLGLFYSLWDLGLFGNPNAGADPFENAPNNTTAKAVAINTASRWPFSGTTHNLTRTNQGWGWIDVERMLERAGRMLVIDESDVLAPLASTTYSVEVPPGETSLAVTLVYRDPPGTPAATLHRVNDLDLRVTDPGGLQYLGNQGLLAGNTSIPGGLPDDRNTVENVFLEDPVAGTWSVRVEAREVNQDAHVETAARDVDYALVISGIEVQRPPLVRRAAGPPPGPR